MKKCLILLNVYSIIPYVDKFAGVMELADVVDSKSTGSDTVPVRVRPPAPTLKPRHAFIAVEALIFYFMLKCQK